MQGRPLEESSLLFLFLFTLFTKNHFTYVFYRQRWQKSEPKLIPCNLEESDIYYAWLVRNMCLIGKDGYRINTSDPNDKI